MYNDKLINCRFFFIIFFISIFLSSQKIFAFDPATVFEKKCSSCHSVGGGDDVGPDLKDITKRRDKAWLVKFIRSSQDVINSGDALGKELFAKFKNKKMPDQELSDQEIDQMLAFIESGAASLGATKIKSALDAKPNEIERGRMLFEGSMRLQAGGPVCLSCHAAGGAGILGGGGLALDLSHAYARYGDKGLSKVLNNIAFPIMTEVYKGKDLTADESYWIKSYLYMVDKTASEVEQEGNVKKFIFLGFIGLAMSLGIIDLAWKKRRIKTRRPL